jgi:hypothetical protein
MGYAKERKSCIWAGEGERELYNIIASLTGCTICKVRVFGRQEDVRCVLVTKDLLYSSLDEIYYHIGAGGRDTERVSEREHIYVVLTTIEVVS